MSWHSFKETYKSEIILVITFLFLVIICKFFNLTCLFYTVTKIPCPTCFMTRALVAVLKRDLAAYLDYNAMALPVAAVFVLELFQKAFGKRVKTLHVCSAIVLGLNFIYYLVRIL